MVTPAGPGESGSTELQFDHAESESAARASVACANCGTELIASYFQVNGNTVCEACRYKLEDLFKGGSGFRRFSKATLLGVGAAAIGAGLWFAVTALTGYELGIIAIVVGLLVGGAVRMGANRRGGWAYQLLAMFLTYSAIVSTYIPPIFNELREWAQNEAAAQSPESAVAAPQPSGSAAPSAPEATPPDLPRPLLWVIGIAFLFAIAFVAPFLAGIENIMGLVIIGIALYEAWKMNKRATLEITGPHRLGTAPQPAGNAVA